MRWHGAGRIAQHLAPPSAHDTFRVCSIPAYFSAPLITERDLLVVVRVHRHDAASLQLEARDGDTLRL